MPNVLIFRLELQNLSECDNRVMLPSGIGESYGQICRNQLVIRRNPSGRVKMRYGFPGLSEAMEQRSFFDQGVQIS